MSGTYEASLNSDTGEAGLAQKLSNKVDSEERGRRAAEMLNNATADVQANLEQRVRGQFDADPVAKAAFDEARAAQKKVP